MLVYNLCIVITQGRTVATCIQSLLCILTFSAATQRGVLPSLAAMLTSADAWQRCSTTGRWPCISTDYYHQCYYSCYDYSIYIMHDMILHNIDTTILKTIRYKLYKQYIISVYYGLTYRTVTCFSPPKKIKTVITTLIAIVI